MANSPRDHPVLADILQPQLKQEYPRVIEPPPVGNANLDMVSTNNVPQITSFPPTPSLPPYSYYNRNLVMNSSFRMEHPLDPISAVLAFQSQENAASRRDAAERQTQVTEVLVDVTKMLLAEQEKNRNFQKEIIEMFATKMSEQSALFATSAFALAPPSSLKGDAAPEQAGGPSPSKTKDIGMMTAARSIKFSPYSNKRKIPPKVVANKKVIGKAINFDLNTQMFTSFACKHCSEEHPTRQTLRKHFEETHQNV